MKRSISLPILALSMLLAGFQAEAAGLIVVDEAQWRLHPPPEATPSDIRIPPPARTHIFAPLEVNSQQAEIRITDQLAFTSIEEEFYNPNPQRMEGTFMFPLPKGAVLKKFAMEIDGRPVEAELVKAEKARRLYEDIVRKAKDPALLEYMGQDLLKVRIFPIEPH